MQCRSGDRGARDARFRFALTAVLSTVSSVALAEAPATAVRAFNQYAATAEARLARQHQAPESFIASQNSAAQTRPRRGEQIIENLSPTGDADPAGALLHHWRGTAFVPGVTAEDFEQLMKNFDAYPQHFAPHVTRAKILSPYSGPIPDQFIASMRVRQTHVITVVMDTTDEVNFGRLDASHGYSISRSTRIDEISSPGTPKEHALPPTEEHGFLWRLNTYWSYEERDGGLYMQIESISMTHEIPTGLGWALRPYIESVPLESLEFPLKAAAEALKRWDKHKGNNHSVRRAFSGSTLAARLAGTALAASATSVTPATAIT